MKHNHVFKALHKWRIANNESEQFGMKNTLSEKKTFFSQQTQNVQL